MARVIKTTQGWVDALKESITEKWEPLSRGELGEEPDYALCLMTKSCSDCPVTAYTGQRVCEGTPYYKWSMEVDEDYPETYKSKKAMAAAEAELALLRKVLGACIVEEDAA